MNFLHDYTLSIVFLHLGEERDEREDTASPVLFSTPPEDPEQLSGIKVSKKHIHFLKRVLNDIQYTGSTCCIYIKHELYL